MFNNEVTRVENFFESRGGRRQCCDSNSQPAAALEPVLRGGAVGNVATATIRQPPANGNSGTTQLQPSLVILQVTLVAWVHVQFSQLPHPPHDSDDQ